MRYPIIQAPMAGVQDSALALAVTRAGGLGSLPAAMLTPSELRCELVRFAVSGLGPFNINFFCHQQREPDPAALARWQQANSPLLRRVRHTSPSRYDGTKPRSLQ